MDKLGITLCVAPLTASTRAYRHMECKVRYKHSHMREPNIRHASQYWRLKIQIEDIITILSLAISPKNILKSSSILTLVIL